LTVDDNAKQEPFTSKEWYLLAQKYNNSGDSKNAIICSQEAIKSAEENIKKCRRGEEGELQQFKERAEQFFYDALGGIISKIVADAWGAHQNGDCYFLNGIIATWLNKSGILRYGWSAEIICGWVELDMKCPEFEDEDGCVGHIWLQLYQKKDGKDFDALWTEDTDILSIGVIFDFASGVFGDANIREYSDIDACNDGEEIALTKSSEDDRRVVLKKKLWDALNAWYHSK